MYRFFMVPFLCPCASCSNITRGQLRQLTTEGQIIFCVNGQYVTAAVSRNEHSFKY